MSGMPRSRARRAVDAGGRNADDAQALPDALGEPCDERGRGGVPLPSPTACTVVDQLDRTRRRGHDGAVVRASGARARRVGRSCRGVPAADVGGERFGLRRAPGAALRSRVIGRGRLEDRLNDGPCRPRLRPGARRASHRRPSRRRAGVRRRPSPSPSGLLHDLELGRLRRHLLAGLLHARRSRSSRRGSGGSARSSCRSPRASSSGGRCSVTSTSVVVAARHLPARMRNGTPSHRHESMCRRTAANVSTVRVRCDARPPCDSRGTGRARGPRGCSGRIVSEDLRLLVADRLLIASSPAAPSRGTRPPAACGSGSRRGWRRPPRRTCRGPRRRSFSAIVICTLFDVAAIPDRLEERVREAEDEEVLHRLLPEVVIDAEDRRLVEEPVQRRVELARRRRGRGRTASPG